MVGFGQFDRIRIRPKRFGVRTQPDPDPQHWSKSYDFSKWRRYQ